MAVASNITAAKTVTVDASDNSHMMDSVPSQSSRANSTDSGITVHTRQQLDDVGNGYYNHRGGNYESNTSHTHVSGAASYKSNYYYQNDRDGTDPVPINSNRPPQRHHSPIIKNNDSIASKDDRLKDLQLIESYLLGSNASSNPVALQGTNSDTPDENRVLFSTTEILHEQLLQHDPAELLDDERLLNHIMSSENTGAGFDHHNHFMWDHHVSFDRRTTSATNNGHGYGQSTLGNSHDMAPNTSPRNRPRLLSTSSQHSSATVVDSNSNHHHHHSALDNGNFSSMAWKPMFQYDHTEIPYSPDKIFTEITKGIPASFAVAAENTVDRAIPSSSPSFPPPSSPSTKSETDSTSYTNIITTQTPATAVDHTAGAETLLFAAQVLRQETNRDIHTSALRLRRRRSRATPTTYTLMMPNDDQITSDQKASSKKGKNQEVATATEHGATAIPEGHAIVENGRIALLIPDADITNNDVLLGRGGRTNHHIGNATYRTYKEALQDEYLRATKDEKTCISNRLVQQIHQEKGRFLKAYEPLKDVIGKPTRKRKSKRSKANDAMGAVEFWYEVDLLTARRKASQALREINTPENRAAKRAKYNK